MDTGSANLGLPLVFVFVLQQLISLSSFLVFAACSCGGPGPRNTCECPLQSGRLHHRQVDAEQVPGGLCSGSHCWQCGPGCCAHQWHGIGSVGSSSFVLIFPFRSSSSFSFSFTLCFCLPLVVLGFLLPLLAPFLDLLVPLFFLSKQASSDTSLTHTLSLASYCFCRGERNLWCHSGGPKLFSRPGQSQRAIRRNFGHGVFQSRCRWCLSVQRFA